MRLAEEIVRLAARGDGVTPGGKHIPGAVPGDWIDGEGSLVAGPHRIVPPCRHFPACGGCQLQHCDDRVLARFVEDRVLNAAASQGLDIVSVLPAHLSPPQTRRRATLHGALHKGRLLFGFREEGSHRIVDIAECHILHPNLFAAVAPLRKLLQRRAGRDSIDATLTLTQQGVDCLLKGLRVDDLTAREELIDFAQGLRLARLSVDEGWGVETVWQPVPVTVSFGGRPVALPAGAFLQATQDGEQVLQEDTVSFLGNTQRIVDLFAGLGTLSIPLAARGRQVVAFEADSAAHHSCRVALSQIGGKALHRDLFRNPLRPEELRGFDAAVIDPPRAGAKVQIEQLAASDVPRIVYVSCNPSSWARDGRVLRDAGYRLEQVRPVGQFRWSTHVELTSLFVR